MQTTHKHRGILTGVCLLALTSTVTMAADEQTALKPETDEALRLAGLVVAWCGFALAVKAARVAGGLLAIGFAQDIVERGAMNIARRPVLHAFVGLMDLAAVLVVFLVLARVAESIPFVGLLALAWVTATTLVALVGYGGIYLAAGRNLGSPDARPVLSGLKGGGTVETAMLLPVVGWLAEVGVLALALAAGSAWFWQRKPRDEETTTKPKTD